MDTHFCKIIFLLLYLLITGLGFDKIACVALVIETSFISAFILYKCSDMIPKHKKRPFLIQKKMLKTYRKLLCRV